MSESIKIVDRRSSCKDDDDEKPVDRKPTTSRGSVLLDGDQPARHDGDPRRPGSGGPFADEAGRRAPPPPPPRQYPPDHGAPHGPDARRPRPEPEPTGYDEFDEPDNDDGRDAPPPPPPPPGARGRERGGPPGQVSLIDLSSAELANFFLGIAVQRAVISLGLMPHPERGRAERDFGEARIFIDMIESMHTTMRGRWPDPMIEHQLEQQLTELKLTFARLAPATPPSGGTRRP